MDFANSQLLKNLADGKLPEVSVTIEPKVIIELVVGIIVAGVAIIYLYKLLK